MNNFQKYVIYGIFLLLFLIVVVIPTCVEAQILKKDENQLDHDPNPNQNPNQNNGISEFAILSQCVRSERAYGLIRGYAKETPILEGTGTLKTIGGTPTPHGLDTAPLIGQLIVHLNQRTNTFSIMFEPAGMKGYSCFVAGGSNMGLYIEGTEQ